MTNVLLSNFESKCFFKSKKFLFEMEFFVIILEMLMKSLFNLFNRFEFLFVINYHVYFHKFLQSIHTCITYFTFKQNILFFIRTLLIYIYIYWLVFLSCVNSIAIETEAILK